MYSSQFSHLFIRFYKSNSMMTKSNMQAIFRKLIKRWTIWNSQNMKKISFTRILQPFICMCRGWSLDLWNISFMWKKKCVRGTNACLWFSLLVKSKSTESCSQLFLFVCLYTEPLFQAQSTALCTNERNVCYLCNSAFFCLLWWFFLLRFFSEKFFLGH